MATTKATNLGHRSDVTLKGTTTTIETDVVVSDTTTINNAGNDVGLKINSTSTGHIMQLQDGGTDVMVVKDGGKVGIGTTPSIAKLQIQNSNDNSDWPLATYNDNGNVGFYVTQNASGDQQLKVNNNSGTTKVQLNSNGDSYLKGGNVGVNENPNRHGYQSGARVLTVKGDGQDDFGVLELLSPDTTGSNRIGEVRFGNMDGHSTAVIATAGIRATRDGADDATALSLWSGGSGSMLERLGIDSSGRVTKPYQPFYVSTWNQSSTGFVTSYSNIHNNGGFTVTSGKIYVPTAGWYYINAYGIAADSFDTRCTANTTSSAPFLFDFRQQSWTSGTHHGCGNGRVVYLASGSYVGLYRLSGTMYTGSSSSNPHQIISIMLMG